MMRTVEDLLALLIHEKRPDFTAASKISRETSDELGFVLGRRNIVLCSFTPAGYRKFHDLFAPYRRRSMPEQVLKKLLDPATLPTVSGQQVDLPAKSGAAVYKGRVFLPQQAMLDVWEWLGAGAAPSAMRSKG